MHSARLSLLILPLALATLSVRAAAQTAPSVPASAPVADEPSSAASTAPAAPASVPAGQPGEAYKRAARLGYQEYELGNYIEARVRFREAHAAFPNARSLRALGAVEYDLKNYPASVDYLEQALASEVRPLRGKLRTGAERLLAMAKDYVATYTVALDPPVAELEVDGRPAELSADGTLMLGVGEHVLTATAEGFREARKSVTVYNGQGGTLQLRLLPEATLPPVPEPPAPMVASEPPAPATAPGDEPREGLSRRNRILVYAAAAVTVVAVGTGLAVGLSGRTKMQAPTQGNIAGLDSPFEAVRWSGIR